MKITQNLLLIFLFLFITNDLFAGLGTTTWGPGGIKRDVEVNEIEEIESEEKQKNTSDSNDEFKAIELNNIDSNTIGTITEDEGGLSYNMWAGSEINIIKDYLKNVPINKESNLAIDLIKKLLLSTAAVEGSKGDTDLILLRISKLIELGDFENAKSLIDLMVETENEEILIKQTEINLSLNNFDIVCLDIEERRKENLNK